MATVVPTVATQRSHLKRKHGEIVDLTDEDATSASTPAAATNSTVTKERPVPARRLEDDEFSGDDGSLYEDVLDDIELNPYVTGTYLSTTLPGDLDTDLIPSGGR